MKKAQTAMEFLMTYGWVLIIILIVLGLLFYLRIFDLPVPTSCSIPNPYICRDMKLDSTTDAFTIKIEAVNIDPQSINNKIIKITANEVECTSGTNWDLRTASEVPVTSSCTLPQDFKKGSRFEGTILLQYQKFGGSPREVTGTFSGKIE